MDGHTIEITGHTHVFLVTTNPSSNSSDEEYSSGSVIQNNAQNLQPIPWNQGRVVRPFAGRNGCMPLEISEGSDNESLRNQIRRLESPASSSASITPLEPLTPIERRRLGTNAKELSSNNGERPGCESPASIGSRRSEMIAPFVRSFGNPHRDTRPALLSGLGQRAEYEERPNLQSRVLGSEYTHNIYEIDVEDEGELSDDEAELSASEVNSALNNENEIKNESHIGDDNDELSFSEMCSAGSDGEEALPQEI